MSDSTSTSTSAPTGNPRSVLCLASFEKGAEFLRQAKRDCWHVMLLTVPALEHGDSWPRDSIDEFFQIPDISYLPDTLPAISHLARTRRIERIVALDDYDVETAAALREHMRLPGMTLSTAKRYRDKLAMRVAARDAGVPVPAFVALLNDAAIAAYTETVPPPWVLKPRAEASTIGIAKIESADDLWPRLDALGDRRSHHLLERFIPGNVYHVDSLVNGDDILFAEASGYFRPPLEVFHQGGLAVTRTLPRESEIARNLLDLNRRVLAALGPHRGPTHLELIEGAPGELYFLEIGARVGGANIAETIEAATGINLWREWARLVLAGDPTAYQLPPSRLDYAGVVITLARQEHPDTSAYTDPEIVWRLEKSHHAGIIVASADQSRVEQLLRDYAARFAADFHASLPAATDVRALREHHTGDHPTE